MSRVRVLSSCLALAALLAFPACGGDGGTDGAATEPTTPVSEGTPSSTADSSPVAAPTVRLEPVAELGGASGVTDPSGDGPVLVSTLTGDILELDLSTGSTEPVLDLSGIITSGGEQGLLDIAIDPDEERLVANLTNRDGATEIRSWPLVDGRPAGSAADGVLHLEIAQPFGNHNGGNLEFGPAGYLWIGTGDGGSGGDPDDRAQNPEDLLGKMLRVGLDPAGGIVIPSDNPGDGDDAVWAIGLRNPWRYSFDPETGVLWIADVGQNEIEEVSVIDPATVTADAEHPNFGWNLVEGNDEFAGPAPADHVAPVITYRHDETGGCSITGGHVYRGSDVDSLRGWYVFGDYCGGWLWALPADRPDTDPVQLAAAIGAVVSIEVLDDGELLVLTADAVLRVSS